MDSRERIRAALRLKVPDRVPITETSYWPETLERWYREGLPRGVDPVTYLGMDKFLFLSYDSTLRLEERIVRDTEKFTVKVDRDGATFIHWKGRYGPPQPLDFLIKTEEDWFRYKDRLVPEESRLGEGFLERYESLRRLDGFLCLSQREPCWKVLAAMMGVKDGLVNMFRKPDLIYDMIATYTDLLIEMYKIIVELGVEIDGVWLRGDLAYKNGLLFSPSLYYRLLYPHHKRLCNFFKSRDIPVIHHIDGDVRRYIPLIVKAGFSAVQPLEARAKNDVRELKRLWGHKIAFIGNISVESLSGTKEEIEREVRSKVLTAKEGGGYIFHSDHSIPPTVSWKNYQYAVKIANEYGKY